MLAWPEIQNRLESEWGNSVTGADSGWESDGSDCACPADTAAASCARTLDENAVSASVKKTMMIADFRIMVSVPNLVKFLPAADMVDYMRTG